MSRSREAVCAVLRDSHITGKLFPGTRVRELAGGVRETITPYRALGQTGELRLLFQSLPSGELRFEKVCDGHMWRFLEGRVSVQRLGALRSAVEIRLEGATRPWIPELPLRGALREQLERLAASLRRELEESL